MKRQNISVSDALASDLAAVRLPRPVSSYCQEALESAVEGVRGTANLSLTLPADLADELRRLARVGDDYLAWVLRSALASVAKNPPTVGQLLVDPTKAPLLDELRLLHSLQLRAARMLATATQAAEAKLWAHAQAAVERTIVVLDAPIFVGPVDDCIGRLEFSRLLWGWLRLSDEFAETKSEELAQALRTSQGKAERALREALLKGASGHWAGRAPSFTSSVELAADQLALSLAGDGDEFIAEWIARLAT